jgi:hypothetical protein
MVKLSHAISKIIIDEYGQKELLRRLSEPLWFQAFGCVLGFDWHSSGVTTVVTGVLKQSINADTHGIFVSGGKGRRSTDPKNEIPLAAEKHFNLSSAKIDKLLYASKMAAKVDSTAIQDGYSLYHHAIIFDEEGNWTIVQQGMNPNTKMARRYHWISENIKSFVSEPHSGIISELKSQNILNMTSVNSFDNQEICVELAKGNIQNIKSCVYKITEMTKSTGNKNNTLDGWLASTDSNMIKNRLSSNSKTKANNFLADNYEMPRRLNWDIFRKIYDIQPHNFEQLISIPGFGSSNLRALSLIGEIIYGTKASWDDPVKFNFAHGGKDGVPYPISRKTYDKSISYLFSAIEGAEIQREEKLGALKKLANYSDSIFNKK